MKKIVFLIPSLGMGGMERVLVNYANILTKYNYDVTVLNFTSSDQDLKSLISKKVHYVDSYVPVPHISHAGIKNILKCNFRILPWIKWIQFHSAKYLYKKYIKEYFDVEVGFCGSPAIKIVSGSDNPNSQKLGWIHGDNILNDVPQAGGLKKATKIYTEIQKLVCVSDVAIENIFEVFGRSENVFKVINPNDADTIIRLSREKVERRDCMTFVCVGRFVNSHKGFDRVAYAVKQLNDLGYEFEVWIIGTGPDFEIIKELKDNLQLENLILFGEQGNPFKYVRVADVFLMPSVTEAYGMVVTEALILGKPVISTNTRGPSEILDGEKFGMITENSIDGIANGMKAVLDSKDLLNDLQRRAELGKKALDPVQSVYSLETVLSN